MKHSCAYDEHALLRRLPIRVRNKLQLFINRKTLETIPLFRYLESDSLKIFILSKMRFHVCDTGNYFFKEDDAAHEVIFLKSGVAELRSAIISENEQKAKAKLKKGGASTMLQRLKEQVNIEEASENGTDDDGEEAKLLGVNEDSVRMPTMKQSLDRLDENSGDDESSMLDTQKKPLKAPRRLTGLNAPEPKSPVSERDGGKSPVGGRSARNSVNDRDAEQVVYSRKSSTRDAALPVGLSSYHELVGDNVEEKTHAAKQAEQKWDVVMVGVHQKLVTNYRVSPTAKARWILVRENLGAIVKMGLNMVKREKYVVIGTLKTGEFIGHQECNDNAEFSYSLVASEECSYYVMRMDLVTALSVDFPDVAMQLESALAHCIMAQERDHALRAWKKRNLGFIEEIKDNLKKDKELYSDAKATNGGRVFFNGTASNTRHRRRKGRTNSLTPSDATTTGEAVGTARDDKALTVNGRTERKTLGSRLSFDASTRSRPTSASHKINTSSSFHSHKIAATSGPPTMDEIERATMPPEELARNIDASMRSSRTDPPAMDDTHWELRSNVSSDAVNDIDNIGTSTFQRSKEGYDPPPLGFLTKPEKLALQMKKASRLLELYESRDPQVEEKIRKQAFGGLISPNKRSNANKKKLNGRFNMFPNSAISLFSTAGALFTQQARRSSSTADKPTFKRQRGMSKIHIQKDIKGKKRKEIYRKNHRSYADALTVARAHDGVFKKMEKPLPTRRFSF